MKSDGLRLIAKSNFRRELEELINRHSMEQESNTPDFILAMFLHSCLEAFNDATARRTLYNGRREL